MDGKGHDSTNSWKDSAKDQSPRSGKDKDNNIDDWNGAGASGGTSRQRSESEGATSTDDDSEQEKRQKTSQRFMIPGIAASPPKFVSLEEIMKAANGMNNMVLAHEIAVDRNFKLEKLEPPDDSIHKQVKETVHKAFWDMLEQELKEVPPNYNLAMVLLNDLKENMMSLLLPQHTKLKEQIAEVLDADLIRQQAVEGVLDFQHYAQYVISVMGKLCAPVRDEKIRELTQTKEVVPMFKGILETLDLMKLDMANFTLDFYRPNIIAKSVEYEKKKFAEFLSIQADGLQYTRRWLLKHLSRLGINGTGPNVEDQTAIRNITVQVLAEGYLELLEWNEEWPYPETLVIDHLRFTDLGNQFWQLAIVGTIMLVTATATTALQGVAAFKSRLREHLTVLLEGTYTNEHLEKVIPNIAEQVVKDVAEGLETHGFPSLDEAAEKVLKGQIVEVMKEDHKIRQLVRTRVREFLLQTITSPTAAPMRIPPGLSSLQTELTAITGQFLRLVSHNRAVFGEYYSTIVTEGVAAAAAVTQASE